MGSIEEGALHICSSGQETLRIASSAQFETNDNTYTYTQSRSAKVCHPDLWREMSKQANLELNFELRHSGEILQTGRQRIPDETDETMKRNERSPTAFKLRLMIFKSFSIEDRQVSGV